MCIVMHIHMWKQFIADRKIRTCEKIKAYYILQFTMSELNGTNFGEIWLAIKSN